MPVSCTLLLPCPSLPHSPACSQLPGPLGLMEEGQASKLRGWTAPRPLQVTSLFLGGLSVPWPLPPSSPDPAQQGGQWEAQVALGAGCHPWTLRFAEHPSECTGEFQMEEHSSHSPPPGKEPAFWLRGLAHSWWVSYQMGGVPALAGHHTTLEALGPLSRGCFTQGQWFAPTTRKLTPGPYEPGLLRPCSPGWEVGQKLTVPGSRTKGTSHQGSAGPHRQPPGLGWGK